MFRTASPATSGNSQNNAHPRYHRQPETKLVDHINRILASTDSTRFAVGYFFLSGLTSIAERLAGVKKLRLLIGNTTNRETLEQIAEGYRRLERVAEEVEKQNYPKREARFDAILQEAAELGRA